MVKIKSEGEYLLKYGAGSIFRKYSQNSRVPSHATFTGLPSAPIPPVLTASIPATAAFNSQVPPPLAPPLAPPATPPVAGTTAPPSVAPTSGPNNAPPGAAAFSNTSYSPTTGVLSGDLVSAVDNWVIGGTTRATVVVKYGDIRYWNISAVTNISTLFSPTRITTTDTLSNAIKTGLTNFNQDINNWNVSNVTGMDSVFRGAIAFNQSLSKWDVSKVQTMSDIFNGATAFLSNGSITYTQGISKWKPTTAMSQADAKGVVKGISATSQPWILLIQNGYLNQSGDVLNISAGFFYK